MGQLTRNYTNQAIALGQIVLQDAKWHMLTLTTLWDGTPGYAMMIDGQLAGVLNGNHTYTGAHLSHTTKELALEADTGAQSLWVSRAPEYTHHRNKHVLLD